MMYDEQSITHFFDIVNNRDLDKLETLLTENAEFYFPKTQPLLGKKQIRRFVKIHLYRCVAGSMGVSFKNRETGCWIVHIPAT